MTRETASLGPTGHPLRKVSKPRLGGVPGLKEQTELAEVRTQTSQMKGQGRTLEELSTMKTSTPPRRVHSIGYEDGQCTRGSDNELRTPTKPATTEKNRSEMRKTISETKDALESTTDQKKERIG